MTEPLPDISYLSDEERQQKVLALQARVRNGEKATREELREAWTIMRASRGRIGAGAKQSKSKGSSTKVDLADLEEKLFG